MHLTPLELPTRPFTYACVVLSGNSQAVLFRHLPRSGSAGGPSNLRSLDSGLLSVRDGLRLVGCSVRNPMVSSQAPISPLTVDFSAPVSRFPVHQSKHSGSLLPRWSGAAL